MAFYIGLMSGTSMDGIDAALVEMPSNRLVHGLTKKYSTELNRKIKDCIADKNLTLASFSQLNTLIGREFAAVVQELLTEAKVDPNEVTAIGSHGQTLIHDANATIPYTLQLGCGHTISSLTNITVVADFRTRDLVNGGQGAPFAPVYHQELFANSTNPVAVVNIGGISNITFISPHESTQGWDVGPGNCLLDAWIQKHKNRAYDADGAWANQGTVISSLLEKLLLDDFFKRPTPKSIGKEYFSLAWLAAFMKTDYAAVDVQATLTALTAHAIAEPLLNNAYRVNELYLCGGGTHNLFLKQLLDTLLPDVRVNSIANIGINPDYLEAMMFAWFAAQAVEGQAINLTKITGAKLPALLGAIYPIKKSY